jgi:uracil-DNA glycosylase
LINIFKELKNDLNIIRTNGDLSDWANQGILLLNSALTYCRERTDFLSLWKPFTQNIIQFIDSHIQGVVFILWGNFAKQYEPLIKNNKDYIIKSGHPSFAASHRQFFNTKPFSKTNTLLKQLNKVAIDW